jgi:predicted nucleic acid-binding protein
MTDYLIDTSAWIEFLRKTGSPANLAVRTMIQQSERVCLTEPVIMELLAGAGPNTLRRIEKLTTAFPVLPVDGAVDYHEAARIYRTVRSAGRTVRSQMDCLIAAVAVRTEAVIVHHDRDFEVIAELCYLPFRTG